MPTLLTAPDGVASRPSLSVGAGDPRSWEHIGLRVGIDFRILGVGPQLINRGMGRFTQQQLRSVVAMDPETEYLLLCRPGDDLALVDQEIRTAPNVVICHPPGWDPATPGDHTTLLRRSAKFQGWLYAHDVDLYHATTPLDFLGPDLVDFDVCPMVATLYDMIPLVFPQHYLAGRAYQEAYERGLTAVAGATRLLAISESARHDATLYLGFDPDRIDVATPVADDCFRPRTDGEVTVGLKGLRSRLRLPERFVMSVTHMHHSKNVAVLLEAYSHLPTTLRTRFPLVLCFHLGQSERASLEGLAENFGVADDIVLTGLVSDEELAALYNTATLLVHPSLYEGFGLPVLEAMRCGTAVVTTTAASLPETAGDAALLVDPNDAGGMGRAITELLLDPARRDEMAVRGLRHAAHFTGERLGHDTLRCYRRALAPGNHSEPIRPRIALWAPLPPEQSGVADYSVELLGELRRRCQVEVFVDEGFLPDLELLRTYPIHHFSAFERRRAQAGFDVVLYQVGASLFHWYMEEAIQRYPGIVVLHDLSWSQELREHRLVSGELASFRQELAELEGDLAARRLDAIAAGPVDMLVELLGQYPMLGRIVGSATAVVVHFDRAKQELQERYPSARTFTVMMGVADPYRRSPAQEARLARRQLALDGDAFVIGIFGIVHTTKRVEASIRALAAVLTEKPSAVLLIVGRALDPGYQRELDALVDHLGLSRSVRFLGEVMRSRFDESLIACDVVVNLRSSHVTHLSSTLVRAMAAGKPVITSEEAGWGFLPEDCCWRIPTEPDEVATLTDTLLRLIRDDALRQRTGASARSFFEREATVTVMVDRYLDVIEAVTAGAGSGQVPA